MYATLQRIEPIARNIMSFWFKPETSIDYVAGQFTELYLPHSNSDERGQKHWFTISSAPPARAGSDEQLFSITTKFAEGRSSTYKQTLRRLQPGARLQFAEPMGDFVLPKDSRIPLLFVAASIGITPVYSMLRFLSNTHGRRMVRLLYNVRQPADLAFGDFFEQQRDRHNLIFTPVVSRPSPGWQGETGRIDAARILTAFKTMPDNTLIYLSGPEIMIERLTADLQTSSIPGRQLVTDFFHGYQAV
jgi:glycine betaine catabolism B